MEPMQDAGLDKDPLARMQMSSRAKSGRSPISSCRSAPRHLELATYSNGGEGRPGAGAINSVVTATNGTNAALKSVKRALRPAEPLTSAK